ncbi:hypothetical protein Patl1_18622 [Pistacia atlantica]|uniref:Uncharacterized protein n=1 Tax=Pistacia atlantica TaxID=434234 RepID=A0ACC1C0F9_9ROSI|nr:hypothetical protein Patl1_18622 [Pistacia atlantica]
MASHNLNKQLKEQFVSNLTGSSFTKIFVLLTIAHTNFTLTNFLTPTPLPYPPLPPPPQPPPMPPLPTTSFIIYGPFFFFLLKVNPFAKLTIDDFSACTPSWTHEFLGFAGSYSFPSLPDTLKLRVQENVKRYAEIMLLCLFSSLPAPLLKVSKLRVFMSKVFIFWYQMPRALLGLISSLAIWDLFKFCSDKWKFDRYSMIRQVLDFISGSGVVKYMKSNHVYGAAAGIVNVDVLLTPTHLAIVMEYAAGSELFARICSAGKVFLPVANICRQLLSCHEICHRDLKLENTLLDGSPTPSVKIYDFGYSKSGLLHSQPKSTVGTLAYIAPEVSS